MCDGALTDRPRQRIRGMILVLALFVVTGCFPAVKLSSFQDSQKQLDQSRLENAQLKQRVEDQLVTIQQQEQLIVSLRHVAGDVLQKLNLVDRLELASLTGGADYDGRPGHDGITVYLRPVDREGDILKSTGEITIKLVDNSGVETPRLLGVYTLSKPEEITQAWHGGFMANHYTVKCPWQPGLDGLPRTEEVEIKATFLDYLTGKSFSANKVVKVTLNRS